MSISYEYNAATGKEEKRTVTAEEKAELAKNKPTTEQLIELARAKRNSLLSETDWTQLPDAPVDTAAFSKYREALRDIDFSDPENIVWPPKP